MVAAAMLLVLHSHLKEREAALILHWIHWLR